MNFRPDENIECFSTQSPSDLKQKMATFQLIVDTKVRGYHVYKDI